MASFRFQWISSLQHKYPLYTSNHAIPASSFSSPPPPLPQIDFIPCHFSCIAAARPINVISASPPTHGVRHETLLVCQEHGYHLRIAHVRRIFQSVNHTQTPTARDRSKHTSLATRTIESYRCGMPRILLWFYDCP